LKRLVSRLTYANVVASLALFLVVAGGSAFAASHLGKNSVGSKQLKKNAVTAAKIKNGAVTGAKIKLGSLGTVPHAASADQATKADTAASADAVNGAHFAAIRFLSGENSAPTVVFNAAGLTLTAQCVVHEILFSATTSTPAEIYASGSFASVFKGTSRLEFHPGETLNIADEIADGSGDVVQGQLVYRTRSGEVVSAQFALGDDLIPPPSGGLVNGCTVYGTVQYS
jgi:hypothetical protein